MTLGLRGNGRNTHTHAGRETEGKVVGEMLEPQQRKASHLPSLRQCTSTLFVQTVFCYHCGHWWEILSTQEVRNQIFTELDELSSGEQ